MSLPRWTIVTLLAGVAALTVAGCPCPSQIIPPEQLIGAHNANAAKVPSLWAVADVSVRFAKGSIRLTDGRLLMLKRFDDPYGPQDFMLRVKEMGTEFFRLGVDGAAGEHYYWFNPPAKYGRPVARWGRIEDLHRDGWETPPIDPTRLLAVLDVMDWRVDPEELRVAAFTPMTNPCVYELFFVAPGERGLQLRKVWIDRRAKNARPQRIWLYDRRGECVMEAELSDYEPVAAPGDPNDRPVMPTDIFVRLPGAKDIRSIRLRLSQMSVGSPETPVEAAMFRRRIPSDIGDRRQLGPVRLNNDVGAEGVAP